jgi:hypothetical protein
VLAGSGSLTNVCPSANTAAAVPLLVTVNFQLKATPTVAALAVSLVLVTVRSGAISA